MGKNLNAYSDLDPTKLNIELVRAIFIYYDVYTHTHTLKHGNTHTNTDSNEYPIVAFSKKAINTTITIMSE